MHISVAGRLFMALLTIYCMPVYAQHGYPLPPPGPMMLFYIQHSDNHNTYVYEAKMENGSIAGDSPLNTYRIVYTDGVARKMPLTGIQRHLAYGIDVKQIAANFYELELVATKDLKFYLILNKAGKPKVYVTVNKRKMYLDRIFLQLKDKPNDIKARVDYAVFTGKDFTTGRAVTEKVFPAR